MSITSVASDPYAPPAASVAPEAFFRQGDLLLVRAGAELPLLCPISGRPVDPTAPRPPRKLLWVPVLCLAFLLFLPLLLLIPLFLKTAGISYSLSPRVLKQTRTKKRNAFAALGFGSLLFIGALFIPDNVGIYLIGTTGILLVVLSLILFLLAPPLRASGYRDGWFQIKGCSPTFLAALPAFPISPSEAPVRA
jgi:hypothetical protein